MIDRSTPEWPRQVTQAHLDADADHNAVGEEDCRVCGLAVIGDGRRHGLTYSEGDALAYPANPDGEIPTLTVEQADEHRCACGNMAHLTGFDTVTADGTPVEPIEGGLWDGQLYGCRDCGRQFRIVWPKIAPTAQITPEQRDEFSALIVELARATGAVTEFWLRHDLPGDFYTPETGYPYDASLDEVAAAVWAWSEAVAGDAHVANGRA